MHYAAFRERVGACVMGATTWQWILDHDEDPWGDLPTWVLTHRDFAPVKAVTFTADPVAQVHAAALEAARRQGRLAGRRRRAGRAVPRRGPARRGVDPVRPGHPRRRRPGAAAARGAAARGGRAQPRLRLPAAQRGPVRVAVRVRAPCDTGGGELPLRQGPRHRERLRRAARPRRPASALDPGPGARAVRPPRRHRRRRGAAGRPGRGRRADGRPGDGRVVHGLPQRGRLASARCAATASASSPATSSTHGLAATRRAAASRPGAAYASSGSRASGDCHRRHGRRRGARRRRTCRRSTAGPCHGGSGRLVGNPHAVAFVDDLAEAGSLLTAPAVDAARLPRRRQRRVRRTPRRAARRDAGARARLRGDPLLRHRRLRGDGRDGAAPTQRRAARRTASTSPAARLDIVWTDDDRVPHATGPAVLVAEGELTDALRWRTCAGWRPSTVRCRSRTCAGSGGGQHGGRRTRTCAAYGAATVTLARARCAGCAGGGRPRRARCAGELRQLHIPGPPRSVLR